VITELSALSTSATSTETLGRLLAPLLAAGDVLLLVGGLGAGKTTFVRGLAAGLGCDGHVTSPTFTLCHRYEGRLPLVHADLWRLERSSEVGDLGLEEELDDGSVVVVEWGEAADELFGKDALVVSFGHGSADSERIVGFEARGPAWADRAGRLLAVVENERQRP
jgi:tRNA threonylcarbamoyladenosine biosynthesis protein TsaE